MQEFNLALCVDPRDNVATVFANGIACGDFVSIRDKSGNTAVIKANSAIPYGHKIAVTEIAKGNNIYKYGQIIGRATADISVGDYVHVHNLDSTRARGDLKEG